MRSNALAISMFALVLGSLGVTHATAMSIAPSAPQSIYQAAADLEMTVAAQVANLRDRPSASGKVLAKLTRGTKVMVFEKVASGAWAHVRANSMEGYISTKLLK